MVPHLSYVSNAFLKHGIVVAALYYEINIIILDTMVIRPDFNMDIIRFDFVFTCTRILVQY